jgi:hypothetical protein
MAWLTDQGPHHQRQLASPSSEAVSLIALYLGEPHEAAAPIIALHLGGPHEAAAPIIALHLGEPHEAAAPIIALHLGEPHEAVAPIIALHLGENLTRLPLPSMFEWWLASSCTGSDNHTCHEVLNAAILSCPEEFCSGSPWLLVLSFCSVVLDGLQALGDGMYCLSTS